MPAYPWLFDKVTNVEALPSKIAKQRDILGVPYPEWSEAEIMAIVDAQQEEIVESLRSSNLSIDGDKEIVALIAYLQKLGTYTEKESLAAEIEKMNLTEDAK